jgi:hypothetical protein
MHITSHQRNIVFRFVEQIATVEHQIKVLKRKQKLKLTSAGILLSLPKIRDSKSFAIVQIEKCGGLKV